MDTPYNLPELSENADTEYAGVIPPPNRYEGDVWIITIVPFVESGLYFIEAWNATRNNKYWNSNPISSHGVPVLLEAFGVPDVQYGWRSSPSESVKETPFGKQS